jgi:hypothetical protein
MSAVTSTHHSVAPRPEALGASSELPNDDSANGQADAFASYKPPETMLDATTRSSRHL